MPEGDTVLRTARGLHRALAGRPLAVAELRWAELGDVDLTGRTVLEAVAYGKHLLIRLAALDTSAEAGSAAVLRSRGPQGPATLHTHLRMDGGWRIHATAARKIPSRADPQVRAVLGNTEWTAVGHLLGMLDLVPTADEHTLIGHLGPDIMADDWAETGRAAAIAGWAADPRRPVGAAMLDQTTVAGIGTIYLAETLFVSKISPWTPVGELDAGAVLDTARRLLLRGATQPAPNTTGDIRRKEGMYVHARSGRPCRRCGTIVRVASVGVAPNERPAFYCPTCQPGPAPTDDGRPMAPLGSTPYYFGSRRNSGLGPPRTGGKAPGRGLR
jgi:endonuclease-8